jgi:hypothetical protein
MRTILLCGAGFTGQLVARRLEATGYQVVQVDRRALGPSIIESDLSSEPVVSQLISQFRPHCVVDCTRPLPGLPAASWTLYCAASAMQTPLIDISADSQHLGRVYAASRKQQGPRSTAVSGLGFEYALSEAAVYLAVNSDIGEPRDICVDYFLKGFWPSAGSACTGAATLSDVSLARYHHTQRRFIQDWPGCDEHVLKRRNPSATVRTRYSLGWAGWQSFILGLLARSQRIVRSAPRLLEHAATLTGPPSVARSRCKFTVRATVEGTQGRAIAQCRGFDPYDITSKLVVQAVSHVSQMPFLGVRTPLEVLGDSLLTKSDSELKLEWDCQAMEAA